MSTKKRLDSLEQQANRQWEYASKGRSADELIFFAIHGYWPESLGNQLPPPQEITVKGIRTVVTAERVKEPSDR